MKIARLLVFSIACLSGCIPAYVTVTPEVHGRVVDAESGQGISDASVHISSAPSEFVSTRPDGRFLLPKVRMVKILLIGSDMRSGYAILVEAKGYEAKRQSWEVGNDTEQLVALHKAIKPPA